MDKSNFYCEEYEEMVVEERHEYENGMRRYEDASHFVMVVVVEGQTEARLLEKFRGSRLSV